MAAKTEKKEVQLDTFDLIRIWRASKTPSQFEKDCEKWKKKKAKYMKKMAPHMLISGKERFAEDCKKRKKKREKKDE